MQKNLINFFKNKDIELFIQIGSSTEYGAEITNFEFKKVTKNNLCSIKT